MKVYLKTGRRNHLMFITPGNESDASDFWSKDSKGNLFALQFKVRFVNGVADVPSNIGKYLIDKGVAQKTALIEPAIAMQMQAQEVRVRRHRMLTDEYHNPQ